MGTKSFLTLENIIGSILFEIGDEENRRYYVRASQWALDFIRNVNIHHSPFYHEKKVTLNDNYMGDYPKDLLKLLSVGIYRNGEFWSFTKKKDMSLMAVDAEDSIYSSATADTEDIPEMGIRFGYKGSNIGYWRDDSENCRFVVRNYRWNSNNQSFVDTTSDIVTKVVIRYKSSGLDCGNDICVPTELKDLITQFVYYKFMRKNIPVQVSADEKDRQERYVNSLQEKYEALMYEPHNFWEVKDAFYTSLNATARR